MSFQPMQLGGSLQLVDERDHVIEIGNSVLQTLANCEPSERIEAAIALYVNLEDELIRCLGGNPSQPLHERLEYALKFVEDTRGEIRSQIARLHAKAGEN